MYTHTLEFTREFTKGTLKGVVHNDSIPFCSAKDCTEWVEAINRSNTKGKCDYKVVAWSVRENA